MGEAPDNFSTWLKEQMAARNWGVRDAARAVGVSHPTISDVLAGRQPSFETCVLVARALDMSPMVVFVRAGLLPERPEDATFEDWKFVLSRLSERDRLELLEFARLKVRLQEAERRGQGQSSQPKTSAG